MHQDSACAGLISVVNVEGEGRVAASVALGFLAVKLGRTDHLEVSVNAIGAPPEFSLAGASTLACSP